MKRFLTTAALVLAAVPCFAQRQVWVRPTVRSDGVYVPGHYRTAPNDTKLDNWSTKGNVNPYTGKEGTVDPYRATVPSYTAPKAYSPYSYTTPKTYTVPNYTVPDYTPYTAPKAYTAPTYTPYT